MAAEPERIPVDYLGEEYEGEENPLEVDGVAVELGSMSTAGLKEVLSRVDEDESITQLVDFFMGRSEQPPVEYSNRHLRTAHRIVEGYKDKYKPKNWQSRFKSTQSSRHSRAVVEARLERRVSKN